MQPLIALMFVEQGPVADRTEELTTGMTIGRAGCDVLLADPDVSRRHAVVREVDGGLGIEDLNSTNGTYLDGQRIQGVAPLRLGSQVRFGNTMWRIEPPAGATRVAQGPSRVRQIDSKPAPEVTAESPTVQPESQTGHVAPHQVEPVVAPPSGSASAAAPREQPGHRGDVPPPDLAPSAIRRVATPARGGPPAFSPDASRGRSRGSAARRFEATVVSYAVVIATAVAVTVYFIQR